jgi:signal transduction histidine kinase/Tfp pilus assembly protein PilF
MAQQEFLQRTDLAKKYNQEGKFSEAEEIARNILKELHTLREEERADVEIRAYLVLSENYSRRGKADEAMAEAQKSLHISDSINETVHRPHILNLIGAIYGQQGEIREAISMLSKAKELFFCNGDDKGVQIADSNIAAQYFRLSERDKALEHMFESLILAEKLGNKMSMANTKLNIGSIFFDLHDYDKGLLYYNKALSMFKKLGDRSGEAQVLNYIGSVYMEQDKAEEAITYIKNSLSIAEDIHYEMGIANALCNLGEISVLQHDFREAKEMLQKSLTLYTSIGNSFGSAAVHLALSQCMSIIESPYHDLSKAMVHAQEALSQFNAIGVKKKSVQTMVLINSVYMQEQEWEKSARILLKVRDLEGELQEENLQKSVQASTVKLLERERRNLEEKNATILKQQSVLEQQAAEIQEVNTELQESNIRLQDLSKFKDSMMSMIVHDLKNPLNAIMMMSEAGKDTKPLSIIHEASTKMLALVQDILDVQKFENSTVRLQKTWITADDIVENAMRQTILSARRKDIQISFESLRTRAFEGDQELLERVIVNLLTNAIKYTPRNGTITIQSSMEPEQESELSPYICISVADTGSGIPTEQLPTIFGEFAQVNAKSLDNARSTGLGLTFCKLVVEAHDGKIEVESEIGKGSTFFIILPYSR